MENRSESTDNRFMFQNSGHFLSSPDRMANKKVTEIPYASHLFKGRVVRADTTTFTSASFRKQKMAMTENLHEPEFPAASALPERLTMRVLGCF